MKTPKMMAILLLSGLLLGLGSCATEVGYYMLSALSTSLPDILSAVTGATTTT